MTSPRPQKAIDQALSAFELAVCQRRTTEATQRLVELLQTILKARSVSGLLPPGGSPAARRALYTRVAALLSVQVGSPDFRPSPAELDLLGSLKPTLEAIYQLSDYEGAAHLFKVLGTAHANGSSTLQAWQIFLICLFLALDDVPAPLLDAALDLPPDQLLVLFAGWMASPFVHSEAGLRNRATLIANCQRVEAGTPGRETVSLVNSAWMHCSYADHPAKHAVKRSLNQVWRRLGDANGVPAEFRRQPVKRPTLLIAAERMLGGHAMQRSYGDSLRQLRSRFRVVCMAAQGCISADTQTLFDAVVVLSERPTPSEVAAKAASLAPDLIYFPSLGMSEWTQIMANGRHAPIQLMTLGHPAPACCDTIDYSLVQAGHGQAAWEFGRKVLERRAWGHFIPFSDAAAYRPRQGSAGPGPLHIAVNSGLLKLSSRFLAVCERIQREASRPLHFHFFASAVGVMFDRLHLTLERRFQHFTLEPSRDYLAFLEALGGCDLALAAFPFGNTNSTVDTCLMSIPTVAYYANEVLSIGDRDVLRMVGLPSWLVADNDEAYFQTAMKLIHDDAARQAIVDQLKATDVKAKLFQPPRPEDETEFVDAFWWIYENHEALQASSAHLIKVGDPIPA